MNEHSEALEWSGFIPFQLVSLLEMLIDVPASELISMLSRLQAVQVQLKNKKETDEAFVEANRDDLNHWANFFESICRDLHIDVGRSSDALRRKTIDCHASLTPLWVLWRDLRRDITNGLGKHSFKYIPGEFAEYYNHDALFGEDVYESYPQARGEITEAGNCYATGSYTGCVFHLMRAVEVALQKMVVDMGADKHLMKRDGGKIVLIPVELCEWDLLIKAINTALIELESGKKASVEIKAKHKFYAEAVDTFRAFRDAWRNTAAHGHDVGKEDDGTPRKLFKEGETRDIIKSTGHFMRHLATRVTDKSKRSPSETTEIW